jgi:hypothetical protein
MPLEIPSTPASFVDVSLALVFSLLLLISSLQGPCEVGVV